MNELGRRTITGAIYVSLIVAALLLGQMTFAALVGLGIVLSVRELVMLNLGKKESFLIVVISLSAILFFAGLNAFWFRYLRTMQAGLVVVTGVVPLVALAFHRNGKEAAATLNQMVLWILIPLFFLVALMDPARSGSPSPSVPLAVLLFIWVNDSFAYLSGILLGRRPLWPSVSPKKTMEGFAGGLIFALVAAVIWAQYIQLYPIWGWMLISLVTALSGTAGDLYESYIKRKAGVKDAGAILPGHGGILDRIDSILFAAPAVFLLIILFFVQ